MSRQRILEIKRRLEALEHTQEERRNEAAQRGLDAAMAIQKLRHEHESEHRDLRRRLGRVERRGFIKSLAILLLMGAWVWSLQ